MTRCSDMLDESLLQGPALEVGGTSLLLPSVRKALKYCLLGDSQVGQCSVALSPVLDSNHVVLSWVGDSQPGPVQDSLVLCPQMLDYQSRSTVYGR